MRPILFFAAFACALASSWSPLAAQLGNCAPAGGLNFSCGVHNPEDLVLVPNTKWLVASGMAPGSGLHLVDTQAKMVRNLYAPGVAMTRPDKARFAQCP